MLDMFYKRGPMTQEGYQEFILAGEWTFWFTIPKWSIKRVDTYKPKKHLFGEFLSVF